MLEDFHDLVSLASDIFIILSGIEEKMGSKEHPNVYAVFDYESSSPDELSFSCGDRLTVLKRDDSEEWWWARRDDKEGYIPRNYFGVCNHLFPFQQCIYIEIEYIEIVQRCNSTAAEEVARSSVISRIQAGLVRKDTRLP